MVFLNTDQKNLNRDKWKQHPAKGFGRRTYAAEEASQ